MDAFEQGIYGNRVMLSRFARKNWKNTLSQDDIDDLIHDTFVGAIRSRHTFRGESTLRSWLIGIFKNQILTHLRRRRDTVPLDDLIPDESDDEPAKQRIDIRVEALQEDAYVASQHAALIRSVVEALPETMRVPVRLYYFDEWSPEKIAAYLRLPEGTIKSRLHYARKKLREQLEPLHTTN